MKHCQSESFHRSDSGCFIIPPFYLFFNKINYQHNKQPKKPNSLKAQCVTFYMHRDLLAQNGKQNTYVSIYLYQVILKK